MSDERLICTGTPASPGVVTGKVVFSIDDTLKHRSHGDRIVLVKTETTPEDLLAIMNSDAVVTSLGGVTSHTAVMAREFRKPCVVGCGELRINGKRGYFRAGRAVVKRFQSIKIDGNTGRILLV